MGLFDIFKSNKKEEITRTDVTHLVESIIARTFACEWFLAHQPVKQEYLAIVNVANFPEEEGIDLDDSETFAQWVGDVISLNEWSSVKQKLRASIDASSQVCIELPSEVIVALADGKDSEVFKKFLLPSNQLGNGKKHVATTLLTPLTDNTYSVLGSLHAAQRNLKQGYDQFYEDHTSIWSSLKSFAKGAVSGLMLASGNPLAMLAGGSKLAQTVSEDAPESKYLGRVDNYLELADELDEHVGSASEISLEKIIELAEKQAIPLVEKYIDFSISKEVLTLEHCHGVLSTIDEKSLRYYQGTEAKELVDSLEEE